MRALGIALLCLLSSGLLAHARSDGRVSPFDPQAAIARSQAAVGRVVGDQQFIDQQRRETRLSEFRGKPLVVSLIFTACAESCPLVMQSLADAVAIARDTFGEDSFSVVTLGFDPKVDTPQQMRAYARSQGIDLPGWRFLSGDQDSIEALVDDLGFLYVPSPRGFDHLAQVSVLDPQGRVHAQVYGASFDSPALVDPLKSLFLRQAAGSLDLANLIERVRLFCTFYDPRAERYYFDYSIFIMLIVGALSLTGLGVILVRSWLATRNPRTSS